jgi:hypothetical protein
MVLPLAEGRLGCRYWCPHQCGFTGQVRILYATQQVPFNRVDQDAVAEIQLRLRLTVLPPTEIDEELAAFNID